MFKKCIDEIRKETGDNFSIYIRSPDGFHSMYYMEGNKIVGSEFELTGWKENPLLSIYWNRQLQNYRVSFGRYTDTRIKEVRYKDIKDETYRYLDVWRITKNNSF